MGDGIGKGILGTISPAYGAATGSGLFGHLMTSLFGKDDKKEEQPTVAPTTTPVPVPSGDLPVLPQATNSSDPNYLNNLLTQLGVYGHTVGPR